MYCGMKTRGDSKDIPEYQCVEQANIEMSKEGQLKMRSGFVKQNATALAASVKGLFGYKIKGTETGQIITAHSTKLETV